MDLTLPTMLPDGRSLWVDADFYQRLHFGDASIGWNGDPTLAVYHENDRLVIVRWATGEPQTIMRSKPGHKHLDTAALVFLAQHDSQRRGGFDPKAYVDSHNAAIERDRQRELDAKSDEAIDKLHRAFLAEYGAHAGGLQKRQHRVLDVPWKENDGRTR